MATIKRSLLDAVLDEAELEESAVRADYSGRYMFGRECLGLVGSAADLVAFAIALATVSKYHPDAEDLEIDWVKNVSQDSMGLSTIYYYYWPKVTVDES